MGNEWNIERKTPLNVKKIGKEAGKEEIDAARARQNNGIKIEMKSGDWRRFFPLDLEGRMLVISVNYTNAKLAKGLEQEGVPLEIDQNAEDSATKSIAKKMKFAMENGDTVKMYEASEEGVVIEGTGGPVFPKYLEILVSGNELLEEMTKIAEENGLEMFLWTRGNRVTDTGGQRQPKRQTPKFKTKLYLIPKGKSNFPEGSNNKFSDIPKTFKKLVDASFFARAFNNPGQNSIVFELTMRQPDKQPTHKISLLS
jgi:hypothetical protein